MVGTEVRQWALIGSVYPWPEMDGLLLTSSVVCGRKQESNWKICFNLHASALHNLSVIISDKTICRSYFKANFLLQIETFTAFGRSPISLGNVDKLLIFITSVLLKFSATQEYKLKDERAFSPNAPQNGISDWMTIKGGMYRELDGQVQEFAVFCNTP